MAISPSDIYTSQSREEQAEFSRQILSFPGRSKQRTIDQLMKTLKNVWIWRTPSLLQRCIWLWRANRWTRSQQNQRKEEIQGIYSRISWRNLQLSIPVNKMALAYQTAWIFCLSRKEASVTGLYLRLRSVECKTSVWLTKNHSGSF